ncbi:ATP phosphoribosyltransferase regulatory subunit [Rhodoblastus acidophilus]|uniref:ATP phosphoribosyltransferase regulatory subunit n=1 Tax=Rhodoblastus acidophilus TaxID=1074 RepID=A0A212R1S4_RHOAC|nr:ATP phosphoribosyltransferase regulatory subunit [Rhodoblastus acidophilus]PPQ40361.1 ATP phosphoribosyltransferase regulatory subunit [Rhodoblastus acidophilus]RAI22255.1 ATP phosphoribosyltransferase regulatory subunit [Rhodoblastus acidophilus]SNB65896.1 ATP phosphoribosyltransferase regulatory subunit [Rhodoblastus acidophilus]
MSAGQDIEGLLRKLEGAGYRACDPGILQPAAVFLDLSGEDMRGRLLLTSDGTREYCLRPEFTIPLSLAYLGSPDAGKPAAVCAGGPVFRLSAGKKPEFVQAGLENFGRADREAADAEILALALETAGAGGDSWRVRIGDASLISALLDRLELPAVWLRRIRSGLAKGQAIDEIFSPKPDKSDHSGVLAALDGADKAGARALVEDLLKIADISALGGRTAGEIADRFLEQAELRGGSGLDAAKRGLLQEFFAIAGQPDQASAQLRALFDAAALDLGPEMDGFDRRLNFLAARGIDLNTLEFSAGFARNVDYYTGFVFEACKGDPAVARPAIAGGRYDGLLKTLGAKTNIPAVGAAIWMERL